MSIKINAALEIVDDRVTTMTAMKGERYARLVMRAANANTFLRLLPSEVRPIAQHIFGELILDALHAVHIDHKNEHHKVAYQEFVNDLEGIVNTARDISI